MNKKQIAVFILLVAGVCFPLTFNLGERGLNEPDEGRYSEMGREMLVTGDWLVPRLNGVPHYAKPPWIYWCVALSLKCFGIHEWSARLPSALAAIFTAVIVFLIGRKIEGPTAGVLSAMILVSFGLFFVAGRLITPDMMLTAFITFSIYCFWSWSTEEEPRDRWLWLMYISMGLGFLDKGPLALVVVAITIVPFLLFQKSSQILLSLKLVRGFLLILAIALPWFLIICAMNPDLYHFYLVGEIKDRFVSGHGRARGWWYHLLWLPLDCWPWTFLGGYSIWMCFRRWREKALDSASSVFLLCWFGVPLIFYCILTSKLPTYVLPILPPLSLMIGIWLSRWLQSPYQFPVWLRLGTALILPIPVFAVWGYFHSQSLAHVGPAFWFRWSGYALGTGMLIFLMMLFVMSRLPKWLRVTFLWCVGMGALHFLVFQIGKKDDRLGSNSSWKSLIVELEGIPLVGVPISQELHPHGEKLAYQREGPRIAMYEFFSRSLSFYLMKDKPEVVPIFGGGSIYEISSDQEEEKKLERDDLLKFLLEKEKMYCISPRDRYEELQKLSGLELPVLKEVGSKKRKIVLFSN